MAVNIEKVNERIDEVLAGVGNGDFDDAENIPDKYLYGHLLAMFYGIDILDGGDSIFRNLYTIATTYALSTVKKKAAEEGKLKVAFLTMSAAMWQAESVYRLLKEDDAFETYIVVAPGIGADEAIKISFRETLEYFQTRGYDVRAGYSQEQNRVYGWEDLGGLPDIVVHLTPYFDTMPSVLGVDSLPLKILNVYIPYGMYVAENSERSYTQSNVYGNVFMSLVWRVYIDTKINLRGFQRVQRLQGKNVVYSGFPKMDYFYESKYAGTEEEIRAIWKVPEGTQAGDLKRVIIAPHHSISTEHVICYSTFAKNAHFLLELAKKYHDRVSFIFKPHPHLRLSAVREQVFPDVEAYDAYLEEWDALDNARVVEEEDYLKIFETSDAMIMDCGSFLGEYMYADKPLLFLTRSEQAFNELGEKLMSAYEQVPGEDYEGIERFLQQTVIDGDDRKAGRRRRVYNDELDYRKNNRVKAGEMIYRELRSLLH